VRVQWNRIRRRLLVGLRNPQVERLTCLTSLLMPSVRALVTPEWMKASIAGHQVSTVVASVCSSSMLVLEHQA
jgi:hypothetical protein